MTLALVTVLVVVFVGALALVLLAPVRASAHCDTMDGPTARDGLRALEAGDPAPALAWVSASAEEEAREVFTKALAVRGQGGAAREVADRWFIENLVRIHRRGEGAAYSGVQPHGVPVDPRVAAADAAVASGDLTLLDGLVPAERWGELQHRFAAVLERKQYDAGDVDAGRTYVEAYVSFFTYAEGENHDHGHDHGHTHAHAGRRH